MRFPDALMTDQFAISSMVRKQPSQTPVELFMRHTSTQGDGTSRANSPGSDGFALTSVLQRR